MNFAGAVCPEDPVPSPYPGTEFGTGPEFGECELPQPSENVNGTRRMASAKDRFEHSMGFSKI